jgi:hypothetical protein
MKIPEKERIHKSNKILIILFDLWLIWLFLPSLLTLHGVCPSIFPDYFRRILPDFARGGGPWRAPAMDRNAPSGAAIYGAAQAA